MNFPKPRIIRRRKYWFESELDAFDSACGCLIDARKNEGAGYGDGSPQKCVTCTTQ